MSDSEKEEKVERGLKVQLCSLRAYKCAKEIELNSARQVKFNMRSLSTLTGKGISENFYYLCTV